MDKNHGSFKEYGGRGIQISKRWEDYENFKEDMSASYLAHTKEFGSKRTSIERVDNNKGYSKDNCRWATTKEQARNTRKNIYLSHNGKTLTLAEWAEILGIHYQTLHTRFKSGWSVERILKV